MIEIPFEEVNQRLLATKEELKKLEYPFFTYHVWDYAFAPFWEYLCRYARNCPKKNIFLGINPGPFGMMQNGIPFGANKIVKQWLGLVAPINPPVLQHSKRPIKGWAETREEESGARLWGLARRHFGSAELFLADNLVLNYCPLGFIDSEGKNVTPDKIPEALRCSMEEICDKLLLYFLEIYQTKIILGVGRYAERQAQRMLRFYPDLKVIYLPHPSPLNSSSYDLWIKNEGELMLEKLLDEGIWS